MKKIFTIIILFSLLSCSSELKYEDVSNMDEVEIIDSVYIKLTNKIKHIHRLDKDKDSVDLMLNLKRCKDSILLRKNNIRISNLRDELNKQVRVNPVMKLEKVKTVMKKELVTLRIHELDTVLIHDTINNYVIDSNIIYQMDLKQIKRLKKQLKKMEKDSV